MDHQFKPMQVLTLIDLETPIKHPRTEKQNEVSKGLLVEERTGWSIDIDRIKGFISKSPTKRRSKISKEKNVTETRQRNPQEGPRLGISQDKAAKFPSLREKMQVNTPNTLGTSRDRSDQSIESKGKKEILELSDYYGQTTTTAQKKIKLNLQLISAHGKTEKGNSKDDYMFSASKTGRNISSLNSVDSKSKGSIFLTRAPHLNGCKSQLASPYLIDESMDQELARDLSELYPSSTKLLIESDIDREAKRPEFSSKHLLAHDDYSHRLGELLDLILSQATQYQQSNLRDSLQLQQANYESLWQAIFESDQSRFFEVILKVIKIPINVHA